MAKKQKSIENKLGNWAGQATLTRGLADENSPQSRPEATAANRSSYPVARSLMTRITEVAAAHNMRQNELIGHLLTWSLDQVESGAHKIEHEIGHREAK